jgi:hypothetical protein
MTPEQRRWQRLLDLARRNPPESNDQPSTPDDMAFFAQRVARQWSRSAARPDSFRVWETVGRWSLAAATAVLLVVAVSHPPKPSGNPLDSFISGGDEEISLFESVP